MATGKQFGNCPPMIAWRELPRERVGKAEKSVRPGARVPQHFKVGEMGKNPLRSPGRPGP